MTINSAHRVAMIVCDGIQALDVTGPLEVFSCASQLLLESGRTASAGYEVCLAAHRRGPVRTSSDLALVADFAWSGLGHVDTLLVSGPAKDEGAPECREFVAWLAENAPAASRYGSVCAGAMLLARAGLLDKRRVATHRSLAGRLAEMAPTARVATDALFVRDDRLWTSAGATAGMDMALAMVEADWGRKLALDVARQLLLHLKRSGSAAQISATLEAQSRAADGRFRDLAGWVLANPVETLSIDSLARQCGMSTRHFARCFRAEMGMTPAKFVESVRFEAACQALATQEPVESIASRCGFGTSETLRRVFIRRTGVSPAAYRRRMERGLAQR